MKYHLILLLLLLSSVTLGCLEKDTPDETAESFAQAREKMVKQHLMGRDITDPRVLKVMGDIPRHLFVDENLQNVAYNDYPLPIGEGQTISQAYVVALMTQSLELKGNETVLEIGTGSGYQAAVLAELVDEVYTIEIKPALAEEAEERLSRLDYRNVQVRNADGYFGWEDHAPYDAIMVTAAVNHIPPALLDQLKDGGRLILPLGSTAYYQTLTLVEKQDSELTVTHITSVRFVPLIGEAEKQGT
jgi:protein-L-isoaspartate(D-aspartate) O-methyltransferase